FTIISPFAEKINSLGLLDNYALAPFTIALGSYLFSKIEVWKIVKKVPLPLETKSSPHVSFFYWP
ncbi:MAG: hypothetical protein WC823_04065, partial [Parcubacteria group bacterium]